MTVSVDDLRSKLASRESTLNDLRARVKTAKAKAAAPPPKSSISDIQKRYLSAVAGLEEKERENPRPVIRSSSDAVSTLANRWNKGIDEKKVERTSVVVRGDVRGAQKNFSSVDAAVRRVVLATGDDGARNVKSSQPQPSQLLVEDDDGLPSWAKNQRKLVIRKENARSTVREVDVRELQGCVIENAMKDGSEAVHSEKVVAGGNVKAALAMWGKTAEEDAKLFAKKKEDEEKRKAQEAKLRKAREDEQRREAIDRAAKKFAEMTLADLKQEPEDDIELTAFLEKKIELIDKEIRDVASELDKLGISQ